MTKYAYIDESGTMPEDLIMTVAMLVIDSPRMATKLHLQAARALYPSRKIKGQSKLQEWYTLQRLHFADMTLTQKLLCAEILSQHNLRVYMASKRHSPKVQKHSFRFRAYKDLVKIAVTAAFRDFDQLIINI